MIAEFAIEPRVMAKWSHFQMLHEDFGVPRGRLIARFPGEWAKQVAQLAHQFTHDKINTPINAKRIEEHLFSERFKRKLIPARRPYEPAGKTWLANATSLEGDLAFQGVVAEANPAKHPRVLVAADLDKTESAYRVDEGAKVLRKAEDLAACARTLLKVSEELILIDPHFTVFDHKSNRPIYRFRNTLDELLRLRSRLRRERPKRLELHVRRPEDRAIGDVQRSFVQRLRPLLPEGYELKVFFWTGRDDGEELHPRFLLTEFGGIKYDYGLDEGHEGERTIVTLLPDNLWAELRNDYCEQGNTFSINRDQDVLVVKAR